MSLTRFKEVAASHKSITPVTTMEENITIYKRHRHSLDTKIEQTIVRCQDSLSRAKVMQWFRQVWSELLLLATRTKNFALL